MHDQDQGDAPDEITRLKADNTKLREAMEAQMYVLPDELAELRADKARLDWLESQAGPGWVARHSTRGRGYRLHQDKSVNPLTTARAAIDAARNAES